MGNIFSEAEDKPARSNKSKTKEEEMAELLKMLNIPHEISTSYADNTKNVTDNTSSTFFEKDNFCECNTTKEEQFKELLELVSKPFPRPDISEIQDISIYENSDVNLSREIREILDMLDTVIESNKSECERSNAHEIITHNTDQIATGSDNEITAALNNSTSVDQQTNIKLNEDYAVTEQKPSKIPTEKNKMEAIELPKRKSTMMLNSNAKNHKAEKKTNQNRTALKSRHTTCKGTKSLKTRPPWVGCGLTSNCVTDNENKFGIRETSKKMEITKCKIPKTVESTKLKPQKSVKVRPPWVGLELKTDDSVVNIHSEHTEIEVKLKKEKKTIIKPKSILKTKKSATVRPPWVGLDLPYCSAEEANGTIGDIKNNKVHIPTKIDHNDALIGDTKEINDKHIVKKKKVTFQPVWVGNGLFYHKEEEIENEEPLEEWFTNVDKPTVVNPVYVYESRNFEATEIFIKFIKANVN